MGLHIRVSALSAVDSCRQLLKQIYECTDIIIGTKLLCVPVIIRQALMNIMNTKQIKLKKNVNLNYFKYHKSMMYHTFKFVRQNICKYVLFIYMLFFMVCVCDKTCTHDGVCVHIHGYEL